MTPFLNLVAFLLIFAYNTYAQSSRVLCGSNQWCYNIDIQPTGNGLTPQTITIYSDVEGTTTNHDVTINNIGDDCVNPAITVRYEEIDFNSNTEYFNVYDSNNNLIQQCPGTQQDGCGIWGTCLSNYGLPISQIDANDTYLITIEGSDELHALCPSSLSLNVNLTITCGSLISGAPTTDPTTFEPSQFLTTPSPTTAEPTSSSCGGANTYCYYVDLYPSSGVNSVPVILQSTTVDTIEYFEIYITSNGGVCNEPYLDIIFQEIDYSAGKPVEYFDVFDQNGSIIVTCEGTQDSQCTFLTCASGLDIGPSFIAADDTYQITVQTGYEHDPFCIQNSFTLNAIINITCDSTLSPTSPTLPPTTPAPTQEPTIEPTAPSVPTTAIPTTQDICNVSLTVVNDWPISKMNGWTVCYDEPYSDYTYPSSFSSCVTGDGYYLFVGAKATSTSQTFYIGAYGPSSVINTTTSSNTIAYLPSWYPGYNVYWYYYPGRSFGYAPISTISLNSADTYDTSDIQRLSWHFGQNFGGYRAGDVTGLNSNSVWRKVVYYKACSVAPTPPTTASPTSNPTAITSAPTPSPTNSRVSCGTYTWCYYVDLFPTNNITSETVQIYAETDSVVTNHNIYITSNGEDCINPTIDVIYEEIDFSTPSTEYFDVFGENNYLITRCEGDQDANCLFFETCLDGEYLPISQIDTNDTYQMLIQGGSQLNTLCSSFHGYSLNVELTINCGGDPRPPTTAQPTTFQPTTAQPTTPTASPTTAEPTSSCSGANTYCYYVDLYPSGGINTVAVSLQSTNADTIEYFEIYITSNGGVCNEPYLDITFQEIDYASGKPAEYFDVFDQNDSIIVTCEGTRDSQCTWLTCASGLDIGPSYIAAGDTYQITVQTGWEFDAFCSQNSFTFNALINVTCDSTLSPTSPTLGPTTFEPTTAQPTINPTAITSGPTPSPTTERVLCGTNTWCYYVYLYPSLTMKTSKTVQVYTIVESVQTFHKIEITSIGYDCDDPRIDVIYEEIDFSSSSEYFEVFANDTLIRQCPGTQDQGCGVWNTCIDNDSLPINQMNEDSVYLMEIVGSTGLNDLCIGFGNDYALNVELTITCSISVPKYCDNVDCGWSFLCDEDTQSCVRDCDAFDIDGYLKCSESWAVVDANISSIVDRVGTIDEADESLDDLRSQLDEINEKIERLSRPFREELNGGHANVNPMAQEITDDNSLYKYSLLNTFESENILIVLLLISNLVLILYACSCQRNNKSGVKYIKTMQEKDVEDISESDSEATENEELN